MEQLDKNGQRNTRPAAPSEATVVNSWLDEDIAAAPSAEPSSHAKCIHCGELIAESYSVSPGTWYHCNATLSLVCYPHEVQSTYATPPNSASEPVQGDDISWQYDEPCQHCGQPFVRHVGPDQARQCIANPEAHSGEACEMLPSYFLRPPSERLTSSASAKSEEKSDEQLAKSHWEQEELRCTRYESDVHGVWYEVRSGHNGWSRIFGSGASEAEAWREVVERFSLPSAPAVPVQGDGELLDTFDSIELDFRTEQAKVFQQRLHDAQSELAAAQERIRELESKLHTAFEKAAQICEELPAEQDVWLPEFDNPQNLVKAIPRMTNRKDCAAALRTYADAKGEGK